jgi:exodeoxyribonuclease-3
MRFVNWNVNGYRAVLNKGFKDFFNNINADIFSIQETKMQEGQSDINIDGYYSYMSSAEKKGYSGTLIYTKIKPLNVIYGINGKYNDEGRVITLEFDNYYFVTAYVPNSGEELKRLDYRMIFEDDMREYLISLDKIKPVIYTGDLNVAHNEIDIKNPKANVNNAGFTKEERDKMTLLLSSGFIDTFRYLYNDKILYSWWSYSFHARENNAGWRIDYYLVSDRIKDKVKESTILTDIYGSDHAPILLEMDI